jgi:hypothetical protein
MNNSDSKDKYLRSFTFVSRNKDNKSLLEHNIDYKQRSHGIVLHTDYTGILLCEILNENFWDKIKPLFDEFVHQGLPGEVSRLYCGINVIEKSVVKKDLQHYLLDNDDVDLTNMNALIARLVEKGHPKATKHWLFDIDTTDQDTVMEFAAQVPSRSQLFRTLHNYAVISEHGFDTREILKRFPCVTLKKNSPVFVLSGINS